ncbi:MAG: DUF1189 family protein [Chloroflexota bacterium]
MQTNQNLPQDKPSFGSQLAWLAAGFVLPFYSLDFYLTAIRKRLRDALLFFTVMMTLVTLLTTTRIALLFNEIHQQTAAAVEAGEFPEITIENGIAEVAGQQPFVITAGQGHFLAVDTGGELNGDELLDLNSGMLLAETELRIYNSGDYQGIPLQDYNTRLNLETIKINGQMIVDNFEIFSITYLVTSGLGLWIWNVVLWLLFLVITTYFLWGPIGQAVQLFTFRSVLIIGIYAHLPAYLINYILKLFGVQIVFLYTILLMVFWVGTIYLVLKELAEQAIKAGKAPKTEAEPPALPLPTPRLWPAVLGLPLFALLILNAVNDWEFAPNYILGGLVLTITGLLVIDSFQFPQVKENTEL